MTYAIVIMAAALLLSALHGWRTRRALRRVEESLRDAEAWLAQMQREHVTRTLARQKARSEAAKRGHVTRRERARAGGEGGVV